MKSLLLQCKVCIAAVLLLVVAGCSSSLVIRDVNYAEPVEAVLFPNKNGVVEDIRGGISFNILPLQYAETQDTSSVTTEQIRMIRGREGFYYITAPGYTNVYVMAPEKNSLKLQKKIKINEQGITEPAFNQRDTHVQLLNRKTNDTYMLSAQGLAEPGESESNQEGG